MSRYAAVYACRRQLPGLADDATWRGYLSRLTGRDSLRALTDTQLALVETDLRRQTPRRRGADDRDGAWKLRALWSALWNLGEVTDKSDEALADWVCRHSGMKVLRWNTQADLVKATECLKAWCARIGYAARPYSVPRDCPMRGRYEPGLIDAQWERLIRVGALGDFANLGTWLMRRHGVSHAGALTVAEAEKAMAALRVWLHRLRRERAGGEPGEVGDA